MFKTHFKDIKTKVGYCGGTKDKPTYREVCTGDTGHAEAIDIEFDPEKVSYKDIVEVFFRMYDPTQKNKQGGDVGTQYRSAIFTHSQEQQDIAIKMRDIMQEKFWKNKGKILTEIMPAGTFWQAEEYHQNYLEKNPKGYECPLHYLRPTPPKSTT